MGLHGQKNAVAKAPWQARMGKSASTNIILSTDSETTTDVKKEISFLRTSLSAVVSESVGNIFRFIAPRPPDQSVSTPPPPHHAHFAIQIYLATTVGAP